ncbi:hypothetical protein DFO77_10525 [Marinilabilia salmonicolor]|jgi:hypothetical protein|uniref:Uncharacterized protein n=1 Tax=Marinilabilia salmonicolor TaxID=989 RepID=A0A2T0WXG2_9BACT|nr:hypothetical protein BY457_12413 [Marinilabilia salmonicolor]RCW37517.1 hypothetical protein DFO77_10525 [Marinilabilia salmonicolor]
MLLVMALQPVFMFLKGRRSLRGNCTLLSLIIGRVATNNERGRGGYLKPQDVALGYCYQAFSLFPFYLSYL